MARTQDISLTQQTGLTLDRYQELLSLPIAAFNGLNKPGEVPVYSCTTIWRQSNRDNLARYLAIAEEKREQELGYFIAPKYIESEEYPITTPLVLNKKHLISVGLKTVTDIQIAATITHRDIGGNIIDPVVLTIATALVVPTSDIVVYYPGELVPIHPSYIGLSAGVLTIKIPRSRLVLPSLNDDREDPLQYDDDTNLLKTVDVKYVSYDATEGVHYITFGDAFAETPTAGAALIKSERLSIIDLDIYNLLCVIGFAACSDSSKAVVRVSYLSGRQESVMTEMQTLRLAHCLMPFEPCSCDAEHRYWSDDVEENPNSIITPYGSKSGAVDAWVADSRAKVGQGGKFPGNIRSI
jgi:hypothetical protein